jgi:hypothetical protein
MGYFIEPVMAHMFVTQYMIYTEINPGKVRSVGVGRRFGQHIQFGQLNTEIFGGVFLVIPYCWKLCVFRYIGTIQRCIFTMFNVGKHIHKDFAFVA